MVADEEVRLSLYKSALIQSNLNKSRPDRGGDSIPGEDGKFEKELSVYIGQFTAENRDSAGAMAVWYMLFYMLENDIRKFIRETLQEKGKEDWWEKCIPDPVKTEVALNRNREQDFGVSLRSEELLQYTTFGQLGDIIRFNWDVFGGILSSQKAVGRVLGTLNALRGPIAHCGVLAEDEVDRLKLSIKDWFRVLAGPQ